MLNKRGPSIDPWGNGKTIPIHVLYKLFILGLCFLFNSLELITEAKRHY